MRGVSKYLLGPFVEALSAALGGLESGSMYHRVDTQHKPAAGRFIRLLLKPGAGLQVTVDGHMKGHLECDNGLAMEADDVIVTEIGESVWERFTAGKEGSLWYYAELVDTFAGRVRPPLERALRRDLAAVQAITQGLDSPDL